MKKIANYPVHIAFIMDGNRRWAVRRGLKKEYGHKKGAESIVEIIGELTKIKEIKFASFFAFSTENWNRDKKEIDAIFDIVKNMFDENEEKFKKWNVKFTVMGDTSRFDSEIQKRIIKEVEESKNNTGLVVNLALNYGGRDDIVRAVNNSLEKGKKKVTENDILENLYSFTAPDIDFLIRTSGEMRLSNFMLFQLAYSELYFPKVCWPSFRRKELLKALKIYSKRNRRFGGN